MKSPSLKRHTPLIADGPTISSINLPTNHQDICVSHMEFIPFTTAGSTSWYEYNNFKSILVSLLEPTPLLALPLATDLTVLSKVISDLKDDMGTKSKEKKAEIVMISKQNLGLKPYNCDEWEVSFPCVSSTQSSNLNFHELSHTGMIKHICPDCGKSFFQSSQLTSHLRIHNRKRPFSCDICQKQFITTTHLKYHKRLHTGERPFACLICEMTYRDKNTLKVHMKKHTEERPFKCFDCGELFKSKPALNQHKQIHLQSCLYSCDKCKKSFKSSIYLKNHLSKMCCGPQSGKKRGRPRKPTTKREFALPSHGIYQFSSETEKRQSQIMKEGDLCIEKLDQQVNCLLDQQINGHEQVQIFPIPNTEPEFVVIHLQTNDANDEQMHVLHIAQVSY